MKQRIKNHQFSKEIQYTGKKQTPTNIHFIQYSENYFEEIVTNDLEKILSLMKKDCVNWIQVIGMNNTHLIVNLLEKFGLNMLDAKNILTTESKETIEELDHNIIMILTAIFQNSQNIIQSEHLSLILGKNYVITFQESNEPLFLDVYTAIKNSTIRKDHKGSDFLLATILNEIFEIYTDTVIQLEDTLENMEDQLLDFGKSDKLLMATIQEKRRDVIRIRKALLPLKEKFPKLLRSDQDLIQKKQLAFYKDLNEQIAYILQNIESCREIMSSLVDLYLNNNDLRMNLIMKQLTVVATIFIPLTFFVGVWGMNFKHMPELEYRYGYFIAWGIMIITAISIWNYFKKKNWF